MPRGPIYKSHLTIAAPVYPEEKQAVEETAAKCGLSVSQWLRLVALERVGDDRIINLLAAAARHHAAFSVEEETSEWSRSIEALDGAAADFAKSLCKRDRQALVRRGTARPNPVLEVELPGEPMPAVCVDEVWLPVEIFRELRDCLLDRVRWFESRGRAVPSPTQDAAREVERAIGFAAGDVSQAPRDTTLARAAVCHLNAIDKPIHEWSDEEVARGERELWEAASAFARSLSPADRERLGR